MILSSCASLVLARNARRSKYPEGRGWRYFATMVSTAGSDSILWLTSCSIRVCGDSSSFGAFARAIASFSMRRTRWFGGALFYGSLGPPPAAFSTHYLHAKGITSPKRSRKAETTGLQNAEALDIA